MTTDCSDYEQGMGGGGGSNDAAVATANSFSTWCVYDDGYRYEASAF